MKIAIIGSRGIPARYGGWEVCAEKLSIWLVEKGLDVTVYAIDDPALKEVAMPVKRVFIKAFKSTVLEKLSLSTKSILHAVFKCKPDVVLLLGLSGAHLIWLLKLFGIKVILNTDGLECRRDKYHAWGKTLAKALEFVGIKQADEVVADSEAIGRYLYRTYRRKAIYIPYGAEVPKDFEKEWKSVKRAFGVEKGSYYIIVGRYVPENNFQGMIDGYLESGSQHKLVVVADKLPSSYLNNERLVYKGPIYERNRLFALRKNAAAYFHGHSAGGTNPSLLEAIAASNPIFAYDVPFNREVLGEWGLYFNTSDELSLLIRKYEMRTVGLDVAEMQAFYKRVLEVKYNWNKVCEAYRSLISEMCRGL